MIKWAKENKSAVAAMLLLVIFIICAMAVQGCNLQSMVKFDVPADVAAAVDTEPVETLDNAEMIWEDWTAFVDRNSNRLSSSIEGANERFAIISSITDLGLGIISDNAATIPGGSFLVAGLSLASGLFLKRPGEDKRVGKEKEDSFNAGMRHAVAIATGKSGE